MRNRIVNQYHDYHEKKRLEQNEAGLAQSKTTEIQLLMKLFAVSSLFQMFSSNRMSYCFLEQTFSCCEYRDDL